MLVGELMPSTHRKASAPKYNDLRPRSALASRVGARNLRQNTTPERLLRAALREAGCAYRANVATLPGCPDLTLRGHRVAVFCDGDFWHGRHWRRRKARLAAGWNGEYWVAKIGRNRERDREVNRQLAELGWKVIRLWESDIRRDPRGSASRVLSVLRRLTGRQLFPQTDDLP
jgi:DNA mismatch endonuclease (patch repair protein)